MIMIMLIYDDNVILPTHYTNTNTNTYTHTHTPTPTPTPTCGAIDRQLPTSVVERLGYVLEGLLDVVLRVGACVCMCEYV
jgi:hypothetical protein